MIKIITVHGTGTPTEDSTNPKWWQTNSAFAKTLIQRFAESGQAISISAFIWSGKNSEIDRRKAGKKLCEVLKKMEMNGTSYHLIGHSHGGSVIEEALVRAIAYKKMKMARLLSVTTVGTPFIESRPKFLSISRLLDTILLPLWLTAILLALSMGIMFAANHSNDFDKIFPNYSMIFFGFMPSKFLQSLGVFFGITMLIAIPRFIYSVILKRHRLSNSETVRLCMETASLRQHLWHADDEAICGLHAAKNLNVAIFRNIRLSEILASFIPLTSLIAILIFLAAGFAGIYADATVFSDAPDFSHGLNGFTESLGELATNILMTFDDWFFHAVRLNADNINDEPLIYVANTAAEVGSWAVALTIAFALAFFVSRWALDYPYQWIFGRLFDRVVSKHVHSNIFGSNVSSDYVCDIRHVPVYVEQQHDCLPPEIATEISEAVDAHTTYTFRKLRNALGSTLYAQQNGNILGALSAQLSWRELIHTSYFDNIKFTNFLILGILSIGTVREATNE
jgi:hypothetical protein